MARIYTTERLTELVRRRLDDETTPYLVADAAIWQVLDEAQNEFVERTHCITDATSFTAAITADSAWVTVDTRILQIRRAYLDSDDRPVTPTTVGELEINPPVEKDYGQQRAHRWRTATGTPKYIVTDMEEGSARLVPIPTVDDTLNLEVYAYPKPIEDDGRDPMIPDRWAPQLLHGVLARLFANPEAEIYAPEHATLHHALWQKALLDAENYFERNRRGPGAVRMAKNGVW